MRIKFNIRYTFEDWFPILKIFNYYYAWDLDSFIYPLDNPLDVRDYDSHFEIDYIFYRCKRITTRNKENSFNVYFICE